MKLNAQSLYVAQILRMYLSGEDNAYEALKNVYGATHEQAADESDMEYIVRCAEQDFLDGEQNAAVYQDVYNEIMQYENMHDDTLVEILRKTANSQPSDMACLLIAAARRIVEINNYWNP